MKPLRLLPGDQFVSKNPMALGRAINASQTIISRDGRSDYSHAGIIIDNKGTTFEALWSNKQQDLFEAYHGEQVCIARFTAMPTSIWRVAIVQLMDKHEGKVYPFHRLPMQFIPAIAKYMSFGGKFLVCSELTAKLSWLAYQINGFKDSGGYCWPRHKWYTGTTPDTLADEWHRWKHWRILFEGVLDKAMRPAPQV